MPAVKKIFELIVVDIVELSTGNEFLKNTISSCDENWLEASKAKLGKQFDDGDIANLFMSQTQKQVKNNK